MIIEGNILTPDEGKMLTNGEVVSGKVYLGRYDSPENWHDCEPDYDPNPPEPLDEERQAELEEWASVGHILLGQ